MRGLKDELEEAKLCTLTIPTQRGGEIKVAAVITGRRLQILCDEFPLQSWISEHKKTVLQAVEKAFSVKLKECRIYADTFR